MNHAHAIPTAALAFALAMTALFAPAQPVTQADSTLPATWDIVADDFEGGDLEEWRVFSPEHVSLQPNDGRDGSTSLSVQVDGDQSYLRQPHVAQAEQGYLTFWFHPNGVDIPDSGTSWVPGKSIRIADVQGSDYWTVVVGLKVRRPTGQGYRAYLEWRADDGSHYDYTNGEFSLRDGWQQITLGYHIDQWVAVWVDGTLVRQVQDIDHLERWGEIVDVGKSDVTPHITPGGALSYDDVAFQIPRIEDLWVDAANGDDGHDGLSAASALRTLQKAADLAGPGTTVHILPGVYRETVWPGRDGSADAPVVYRAENGPGTAILRGSEPASALTWTRLSADSIGLPPGVDPSNLYYADLSAWELDDAPRFVLALDDAGAVTARLPLAREPDWTVATEWKHHEFWWAAQGGSDVAACDPPNDEDARHCDRPSRAMRQLTDREDDAAPAGIEAGNLSTLGDLRDATLVAIDTRQGHYVYRRTITAHDVAQGRVTVDRDCEHDTGSGDPGLGWGTKYYVEGKPNLLDSPGEWWYDADSERLYLWPPQPGDPATMNIEISRRDNGVDLKYRSYVTLDGLTLEGFNQNAITQANYYATKSYSNTVRHATLRYANRGLYLEHSVRADAPPENVTDGFVLEDSEIAHMDTHAIRLTDWWGDNAAADDFTHSGIINTVIRNNKMHHLGFRSDGDNAIGAVIQFAHRLRFEGNHVHHVANNGIQLTRSVIQSPQTHDFAPEEIKTGEILIKDNVFEQACQLTTDCGGLKVWGRPFNGHVFRDLLITGNVFRHNLGWSYVAEQRGRWYGGPESDVQGLGGFGLYVNMASGVHVYRNVAYKNGYAGFMLSGTWRDGDVLYYNNVSANALYGFNLSGDDDEAYDHLNVQFGHNLILNNEGYGVRLFDADADYTDIVFDYNLYDQNGWRDAASGGLPQAGAMAVIRRNKDDFYYPTLPDVQTHSDWETHGVDGNPRLADYDRADHDLFNDARPDWHLTSASTLAIDRGRAALPASLDTLLARFAVEDPRWGATWDIGRYELGFGLRAVPSSQRVSVGEAARYTLHLFPSDMPGPITLRAGAPAPALSAALVPQVIPSGSATINVTSTLILTAEGTIEPTPGIWYTVPITGSNGVFTFSTQVRLLVGGQPMYLPFVMGE